MHTDPPAAGRPDVGLSSLDPCAGGLEGHLAALRDHVLRGLEEPGADRRRRQRAGDDLRLLAEVWSAARAATPEVPA